MADNFERVKTEILQRNVGKGGPTPADLLEAIEATNTDNDEDHKVITGKLDTAIALAAGVERRVKTLEGVNEDNTKNCSERVRKLFNDEHSPIHQEHVDEMHKLDEESYDIKKLYRMVKWAIIIIGGGVLVALADQIGHLVFGGAT